MLRVSRFVALLVVPALLAVPMAQAQDVKPAQPAAGKLDLDLPALFKKLDADGDGKLTAEEFKKFADLDEIKEKLAPKNPLLKGFDLEKLKEKIGPEKLEKLKEKLGGKLDPEKIKELIEKRKNKDK